MLVGPVLNGWIGIYPETSDQQVGVNIPARGVTLAFAETAGATRRAPGNLDYHSPVYPHRIAQRFIYTQPRPAEVASRPPRAAQFRYPET